ncbi:MAG: 4Fe-4S single cluster domain of Ferredoxin I [Candidatus Argoarchaeum ethanivorans]|uniref:Ferredoxin n=1 Tax=Candidatus Argoarchaeum ethanivorans TaxID=2608793 RepID=A0A811T721_9EURY|nr:MAG: 4Fe-4S single cluster domain of Ferredoxin I [Candidatus Argoarchaeum ethanivorans]
MVQIDTNKCTGCGVCVKICPDGFEVKEKKAVLKNSGAECIDEAAAACPVGAIISDSNLWWQDRPVIPARGGRRKKRGRGGGRRR